MEKISKVFVASILLIAIVFPAFAAINKNSTIDDGYYISDDNWKNLCIDGDDDKCENKFFYVGRDLTTQGDWIESGYGDCGYALPYANVTGKEVAIGETTGIGEPAHEFWWREPWSVPGEKYYSYEDYLGGLYILEYNITGPEGPPRALVDADSMYYRPSWYCHDSSITVTLNGITGNYNLLVYLLDWDAPRANLRRRLQVNVTSSGDWDTATLGSTFPENFAAGTYAIFEVNSDGTIKIEVTKLGGENATLSGIFLDSVSGPLTGVRFVGLDRGTKGNWRSSYGSSYYLLPGFDVPVSNVGYSPIDKSYDVTNIPLGNYVVSDGVCQYAADDARTYGEYPYIGLYAGYTWTRPVDHTNSDTRVLIYPEDRIYYGYPPTPLNGRIFGAWDSGELGWPLNYFIIRLKIPEDGYILSVYAMDFSYTGRSETIEIWDESMTSLMDSQYITAAEINNGIYVQWMVGGPRIINIKVIADPGKLNSFIDGIFLNCLCYCGKTIGFWKNNILKALDEGEKGIQVPREAILRALDTITGTYGIGSVWNFNWLNFTGSDDEKLSQALDILQFDGWDMEAKARAQILALLLTDTHYGKHLHLVWIWWYEGGKTKTITGWITTILNEYNAWKYCIAEKLAYYLNNYCCCDCTPCK